MEDASILEMLVPYHGMTTKDTAFLVWSWPEPMMYAVNGRTREVEIAAQSLWGPEYCEWSQTLSTELLTLLNFDFALL